MASVLGRWLKYVLVGDGCWIWDGAKTTGGYGHIRADGGRLRQAHRVGYEQLVGPIPPGLVACHRCDNPACVRPDHLFLGTQQENNDDMRAKGRGRRLVGERSPHSKLTKDVIAEMRAERSRGLLLREIAALHGVAITTAHRAILGQTYKGEIA